MSIISTVLLFVIVPAVFMAGVAALTLAGSSGRRTRRYRPGRPYEFAPIWFLARPEQVGGGRPTVERVTDMIESGARVPTGATGGASDRW